MIQSKKRERKGMNKALTEKGVNYSRLPFLFTFIFLFLISFSSAQGFIVEDQSVTLYTFQINQEMQITNFCASADCTYANLTRIISPNGTITYPNVEMTKNGNNFNYSYIPIELGTYSFTTCSNPEGIQFCETDSFDVTSTGSGGSLLFIIIITFIAVLFFIASLISPEEFFVYISGVAFLIGGVYLMINGLDVLNDTNTRYLAYIYLGIGLLFTLGAYIYNWIYSQREEEY
jgi:hypothetical protein